ncbi:hypothetical protein AGMMS5026_10800 [Endomicrobiia bacterium]|nr:hypothetical protein AGMMS49523_10860 [Endomicrobiia bacterium]GHT09892.1 hypothetical protein AGMMS49532_08920 [Endomicrobiia bacterium]GHT14526.1 hypothetical protein AGMMS49571_10350 [Endomicrobiia bacterium]GHT14541.1 hypothetical protein AGMMS49571_10400 [Endomicrobiia bacterium]GHT21777.1 hypothetical protein AGMMS49929_10710 [Endomicrobiia bacterium]
MLGEYYDGTFGVVPASYVGEIDGMFYGEHYDDPIHIIGGYLVFPSIRFNGYEWFWD